MTKSTQKCKMKERRCKNIPLKRQFLSARRHRKVHIQLSTVQTKAQRHQARTLGSKLTTTAMPCGLKDVLMASESACNA
eukprot:709192-Amphidinium_carterae.1